jgi:hypothetical protein
MPHKYLSQKQFAPTCYYAQCFFVNLGSDSARTTSQNILTENKRVCLLKKSKALKPQCKRLFINHKLPKITFYKQF